MKKVMILAECGSEVRQQLAERFGGKCELIFPERKSVSEELLQRMDAVIGEPEREEILAMSSLRWIQITWAGADKYMRMKDVLSGITLTNVSGAFGTIIAEYVIGSVIAMYRAFPRYYENQKKHVWRKCDHAVTLYGKKALILGTGDIGRNIANRLKAFGVSTAGIRRQKSSDGDTVCVSASDTDSSPIQSREFPRFDQLDTSDHLDDYLPEADLVIGCLPCTPDTTGLMSRVRLALMKPDALFVNVGRGNLVRSADLIDALQEGALGGAILDVFETEPLPEDSPLWDMENVMITPHISGPSFGGNQQVQDTIWEICMENMEHFLNQEPLQHVVDLEAGY